MTLPLSLPARVHHFAAIQPDRVALREKQLGIWRELTFRDYDASVQRAAWALHRAGVRPGDHVAILSDNRAEWLYVELGTQAIGGRSVGIYQTDTPDDVAYLLNDSRARLLFCEDQEQVDKAVTCRSATPLLERVVVFDPRGTRAIPDPRLGRWQTFLADAGEPEPGWFEAQLAARDPDEPAMIVYTSGTTGPPKGAMLSSRNVLEGGEAVCRQLGITANDSLLSYLPLCHVAEKIFTLFLPLTAGCSVCFGEALETVQADLREVSPTIFLGVPRIWEKMHAGIALRMKDASWLKRTLYDFFVRRGAAIAQRRLDGGLRLTDRIVDRLGDLLVFRPLQERLGLRRCRLPVSGAAPISRDLLLWFHGIGIPVLEGYGQTEGAGTSHLNLPGAIRLGTVGRPLPQVECRIDGDGEILVRGPNVFRGYLDRPDATRETVDAEGWLHTGDVGEIDPDGFLSITGRKKEIIITSGGKNLSPEHIENALKTSPYIKEAVAVGDQRNFVAALVQLEYDAVSDWAARHGIAHTSYADLAAQRKVDELIHAEVDKANQLLSRVEQVRAFRILPRELHQDDGELTPTQKVRRRVVFGTYANLVDTMYSEVQR
ncbi:MAG TPA: AMP-binding protein [Kofleriaceae bacterium]